MYYSNSLVAPTRMALAGMVIGVASGLLVAQMNPGPTLAAVAARAPFNIGKALDSNLFRRGNDYYAEAHAPDVSLTPISDAVVRKIGYGQTSFVNVMTTASGTYSSDALGSPYVRYPGIFVAPLKVAAAPVVNELFGWSRLSGWVRLPLGDAGSISLLDTDPAPASQNDVCVTDTEIGGCR